MGEPAMQDVTQTDNTGRRVCRETDREPQTALVEAGRLQLKAGRLSIDLDGWTSTGTILLDQTRFPVKEMTVRIVAGRPVEVEAKFWTERVADAAR